MSNKIANSNTLALAIALGLALQLASPKALADSCCSGGCCGGGGTAIEYLGKQITLDQYLAAVKLEDGKPGFDKNDLRKLYEPQLKKLEAAVPEFAKELRRQFETLTWYKLDRPVDQLPYELTHYLASANKNGPPDLWQTADSKLVFMDPKYSTREQDLQSDLGLHDLVRAIYFEGKKLNTSLSEGNVYAAGDMITQQPLAPAAELKARLVAAGFEVEHLQSLATKSSTSEKPVVIPVGLVKGITLKAARKAVLGCIVGDKEGSLFQQMAEQSFIGKELVYFCSFQKYPLILNNESHQELTNDQTIQHFKEYVIHNYEECIARFHLNTTAQYRRAIVPDILPELASRDGIWNYLINTEIPGKYLRRPGFHRSEFRVSTRDTTTLTTKNFRFFRASMEDYKRNYADRPGFYSEDQIRIGNNTYKMIYSTDHDGAFNPAIKLPELRYEVANPLDTVTDAWGHINENRMLKSITILVNPSALSGDGLVGLKTADELELTVPAKINVPAYANCLQKELENASQSQDADANSSSINTAPAGVVKTPGAGGDMDAAGGAVGNNEDKMQRNP